METLYAHGQDEKMWEVYAKSFPVGDRIGRYRLLLQQGEVPIFHIRVTLGDACASAPVGGDLSHAAELFELLVRCGVTPCSFEDVLYDLGVQ